MNKMNYKIRKIKSEEKDQLKEFSYQAIFVPEGKESISREVLKIPEIKAYYEDFGSKKDDHCFVAVVNGMIVGAVWVRIITGKIKGYGNIDEKTPEFALSLFKDYRNQGIGTALMKKMINHLKKCGYDKTSLSVNKDNYAFMLYKKLGFKTVATLKDDYLMVLDL